MTRITLGYSREDAKTVIKASLELLPSIDEYADEGQRIIGKQEASITGGNGVTLTLSVPEMQERDDQTVIDVSAEKEVPIDQSADPGAIEAAFLDRINEVRGGSIEEILEEMSQQLDPEQSKEVSNTAQFGSAGSAIGARFLILFALSMLFMFFMMAMMTP